MRFRDTKCTPVAAARFYATNAFEGIRSVNVKTFQGSWTGRQYGGTFQLSGGKQVYLITCDADGWWQVTAEIMQ